MMQDTLALENRMIDDIGQLSAWCVIGFTQYITVHLTAEMKLSS